MPDQTTIDGLSVLVERAVSTRRPSTGGPARPPILLLHGYANGAWYWEKYQGFLSRRGYTSHAPNLRGRPGSRAVAEMGRVTLADYLDDVLAVVRSLDEPPVVIGHSMGGLLAQQLAERGVVRAAVLLSSAPPRGISMTSPALAIRQLRQLPALLRSRPIAPSPADLDAIVLNRVPAAERPALHPRFVPDSGTVGRELSVGAVAVDAARVRCPVLSVSAADDRFIAPAVGRRIAQKYHAPYRVFAHHAHFLPWEPEWERPAADVERWIAHALDTSARTAAADEALWARLKARIGDVVTLHFYDGRSLRAELVSVDLAAVRDLVFDVREVLDPGSGATVLPAAGETTSAALSEVVALDG